MRNMWFESDKKQKYEEMKKVFFHALLGAIALTGTVGFSSCSERDVENVSQERDRTRDDIDVPVNFVFNIGIGSNNSGNAPELTRMSANTVQAGGDNFRGILEARVLAYMLKDADGNPLDGRHVNGTEKALRMFNLSQIAGADELSKDNSTRVIEVSLPNGTNSLMFYGRAPKDEDVADPKQTHKEQGYIKAVIAEDNTADMTKFMLMPRISQYVLDENGDPTAEETEDFKRWTQVRSVISTVLTRVAKNGLAIHHYPDGSDRDRRFRLWWPDHVENYNLNGPSYTADGTNTVLTADNSNIAEIGEGTADLDVKLSNGTKVGEYKAATKRLTTNLDSFEFSLVTVAWKEYGEKYLNPNQATAHLSADYNLSPLEEILGKAYVSFTTMKEGEIRAGSALAVTRVVQDLWTVTNKVLYATPTYLQEAIAQGMAMRLHTRCNTYFSADIDSKTGIVTNCKLRSPKTLVEQLTIYETADAPQIYSLLKDDDDAEDLNLFPMCHHINMPPGSTQLSIKNDEDGYKKFVYNETMAAYGMGMTDVSPLKYTWPAELMYYGNSPIRTSEKTYAPIDFPRTVSAWHDDSKWGDEWSTEYVTPVTRSVAMKNNIGYSTALLDTRIYYKSARLKDNNEELNGEPANEMLVGEFDTNGNHKFELTGIVIGGQPKEVRWDFISTKGERNYLVYDNDIVKGSGQNVGHYGAYIPGYSASKPTSAPNYTMVWDNWNPILKGSKQDDVYIALEFLNNSGRDFWGCDNLVINGSHFYLIGKLDPNVAMKNGEMVQLSEEDLSDGITWPTDRALPPYDDNGNTIKERRVFMQGFKTLAKFGIGENSLKSAYLTVPDLRSSNISLGLSVDLEWKDGLQYDVELGK